MQGRPVPSEAPEAELWIGDHPTAPSRVRGESGTPELSEWIAGDRARTIGPDAEGLPFLVKILAAARSLSVQVHPDGDTAATGFRAEETRGRPRAERCYPDPHPKHEILVALTDFEALCGFRDDAAVREGCARVPGLAAAIEAGTPSPLALRLLDGLQRLSERARGDLLEGLAAFAAEDTAPEAAITRQLLTEHPGDLLACAPLFLNAVSLAPTEALVVPPGTVHTYLRGTGVEVMTRSDNVVRAGLTPKHVDPAELLRVTHAVAEPARVQRPAAGPQQEYDAGSPAFQLRRVQLRAGETVAGRTGGPAVLLCVEGALSARAGGTRVDLGPAEAAFVPACCDALQLEASAGTATVFEVSSR